MSCPSVAEGRLAPARLPACLPQLSVREAEEEVRAEEPGQGQEQRSTEHVARGRAACHSQSHTFFPRCPLPYAFHLRHRTGWFWRAKRHNVAIRIETTSHSSLRKLWF